MSSLWKHRFIEQLTHLNIHILHLLIHLLPLPFIYLRIDSIAMLIYFVVIYLFNIDLNGTP